MLLAGRTATSGTDESQWEYWEPQNWNPNVWSYLATNTSSNAFCFLLIRMRTKELLWCNNVDSSVCVVIFIRIVISCLLKGFSLFCDTTFYLRAILFVYHITVDLRGNDFALAAAVTVVRLLDATLCHRNHCLSLRMIKIHMLLSCCSSRLMKTTAQKVECLAVMKTAEWKVEFRVITQEPYIRCCCKLVSESSIFGFSLPASVNFYLFYRFWAYNAALP